MGLLKLETHEIQDVSNRLHAILNLRSDPVLSACLLLCVLTARYITMFKSLLSIVRLIRHSSQKKIWKQNWRNGNRTCMTLKNHANAVKHVCMYSIRINSSLLN